MFSSELLYQILLSVLIIASVFLILVLWRLFRILSNVDKGVEELKDAATQINVSVHATLSKISEFSANFSLIVVFLERIAEWVKVRFSEKGKRK